MILETQGVVSADRAHLRGVVNTWRRSLTAATNPAGIDGSAGNSVGFYDTGKAAENGRSTGQPGWTDCPDPLLAQLLAASTYPLEIVQAHRWLETNKNLKGEDLTKAAQKQPWDPSVQALVAFPEVLKRLDENL